MPKRTTAQRFAHLVRRYMHDVCSDNPELASNLGFTGWDGEVGTHSAAAYRNGYAGDQTWLRRFEAFNPARLTPEQQIDRELILAHLRESIAVADFQLWRRDPSEYLQDGVFDLFLHGFRPEHHAVLAAVKRLRNVPVTLEDARKNLSAALADPLVVNKAIAESRGQAAFLRTDLLEMVRNPLLRKRLAEAADPAAAAYDDFAQWLEGFAQRAHGSFAYGERHYNAVLQKREMLDIDARTLRNLGQAQLTQLNAELAALAQKMSGNSDWRALLNELQKQHPASEEKMVRDYQRETARARQFARSRRLMTMPAGEKCDVLPAPKFMRGSLTVASYFSPAMFRRGTRGRFNIPVCAEGATPKEVEERLQDNAYYSQASLVGHECYIGHHAHLAKMGESRAIRRLLESTYFVEGWALYVEKMLGEQGYYRNDAEVMGQMVARLWRAARIVVDVSLHLGEMSVDDAVSFMHRQVGLPVSVARGEVVRYCSWPTQASAYLTGAMIIEELRDQWLTEGKGSLKEFHDAITASGALPLGLLPRALGLEKARPAAGELAA